MQLRNLIKYKQLINSIDDKTLQNEVIKNIEAMFTDLNTNEFNVDDLKQNMQINFSDIIDNLDSMSVNLNKFKEKLNMHIDTLEKPYYDKSKAIYKTKLKESAGKKLDRQNYNDVLANNKFKNLLIQRIGTHVDNRFPGLQLAPGNGEITNQLVMSTPLYLMDENEELFRLIRNWRSPAYQKRLRYYILDENQKDPMHELPQNQFGVIVAINWFNFRPLKVIRNYLQSMWKILRPGGVIIFTYNNCDYPKAVDKVDESYYCYTTGTDIECLCNDIGYNIIKSFNEGYDELDMGISWLEINKPGKRTTIRNTETMGLIKQLGEN